MTTITMRVVEDPVQSSPSGSGIGVSWSKGLVQGWPKNEFRISSILLLALDRVWKGCAAYVQKSVPNEGGSENKEKVLQGMLTLMKDVAAEERTDQLDIKVELHFLSQLR